ncbi:MAG: VOC family protein [Neomegalonema sp.]|nr:VOC family protein [Neomegalonema sp.]
MAVWFDHLVIGADSLEQGADWAKAALGVAPPIGGAHPAMGTHNRLMRLAYGYLEVIAIDPSASAPGRRRWYGMDEPAQRARMVERPRPIAFVLATDALEQAAAAAAWDVGEIIDVSRGELRWRMAVRSDGAVAEGVLPVLIEWPEALQRRAPTSQMAASRLALRSLRLLHPQPARIQDLLSSLEVEAAMIEAGAPLECVAADAPSIEAMLAPERIDLTR